VSATVGTLKLCIIISGFKNENICILWQKDQSIMQIFS
jgi:hypothetical protein